MFPRHGGDVGAGGLIGAAANVFVGQGDRLRRLCGVAFIGVAVEQQLLRLRPFRNFGHIAPFFFLDVAHVHVAAGLDPFIYGAFVAGVAVRAHPTLRLGGAAPVVHEDAPRSGGHGVAFARLHLVDGLAVHEPADIVFRPAEAVVVELFGSVEPEIVHVLVPALAVHIVVELHLRGVFAQKLDVDLVPGVGFAFEVDVVIAGAGEEGARRARFFGGLHAHFKVAVAVPLVRARLAAEVFVVGRLGAVRIFVDGQLHHAAFIRYVVGRPPGVEHAFVRPAVRREEALRLPLGKVCHRFARQRLIRQHGRLLFGVACGQHHSAACRQCQRKPDGEQLFRLALHTIPPQ